jgi:uncharacterized C2H2 Zn-finger protein
MKKIEWPLVLEVRDFSCPWCQETFFDGCFYRDHLVKKHGFSWMEASNHIKAFVSKHQDKLSFVDGHWTFSTVSHSPKVPKFVQGDLFDLCGGLDHNEVRENLA